MQYSLIVVSGSFNNIENDRKHQTESGACQLESHQTDSAKRCQCPTHNIMAFDRTRCRGALFHPAAAWVWRLGAKCWTLGWHPGVEPSVHEPACLNGDSDRGTKVFQPSWNISTRHRDQDPGNESTSGIKTTPPVEPGFKCIGWLVVVYNKQATRTCLTLILSTAGLKTKTHAFALLPLRFNSLDTMFRRGRNNPIWSTPKQPSLVPGKAPHSKTIVK